MAKNPEVKEVSIDSVKTDIEQLSPEDKKTLLEKLSSEVQAEKAEIASEIQDLKEKVVSLNKEDITFKLYNGVEKSAIIKAIEAVSDESKKTSLIKALKDKDVVAFQKAL
jgi:DNA-binding transcriptional MerR regulator